MLLKIEGPTFTSGAPFWLQKGTCLDHFASKIDAQIDKKQYSKFIQNKIKNDAMITVLADEIVDIIVNNGSITGDQASTSSGGGGTTVS